MSGLISRNVTIGTRRTSLRLEQEMWDALSEICLREGKDRHEICSEVADSVNGASFTSSVRVYILNYFRAAALDKGHRAAGHGPLPAQSS
ncbi:ribbon-helix-helix domain-containing protein [Rhodovibrionaceae bacterium A322]